MAHIESQGSAKGSSQDFELNLAPIIDCLVVLIAFLMVSLSYLSVQMLDAGMSSPGGLENTTTKGVSLEISLLSSEKVEVSFKDQGKVVQKQSFDLLGLDQNLVKFLAALPKQPEMALIQAQNDVTYDVVIRAMDLLRNHVKQVQLSGF